MSFVAPYEGDWHELFLDTVRKCMTPDPESIPYCMSMAVIQCSGMGKSRMMQEAVKSAFGININIREALAKGIESELLDFYGGIETNLSVIQAYPPPDIAARDYFANHQRKTDLRLQIEYAVFLNAMFEHIIFTVNARNLGQAPGSLPLEWSNLFGYDPTMGAISEERKTFFEEIVDMANQVSSRRPKPGRRQLTIKSEQRLEMASLDVSIAALRRTCDKVSAMLRDRQCENLCLVSFDEAHGLAHPRKEPDGDKIVKSPYHNLEKVLTNIKSLPFFFAFLSTNSNLHHFAPATGGRPSGRKLEAHGEISFPPYTELPFDVFTKGVLCALGKLTLNNVSTMETMAGFGRAL
jgi:hypothetical protein